MSLVKARYNMKADIYVQTTSRHPETRQVMREWDFYRTVLCQARSIASEGIRTVGSTENFKNGQYEDDDYVRIRVSKPVSKRDRVRNIRHKSKSTGQYLEDNGSQEEFEVIGVQPSVDPFGRVVEYELLLYKVQDQ